MKIKEPKNILVVRTDRLGDVVLTTSVFTALRQAFPDAYIACLVKPEMRDLISDHPDLNQVLVDDRKGVHKGVAGFWRLVKRLKQGRFDTALIFHTKRRANALCWLAGIAQRIGFKNDKFGFLLTHPLLDERHLGHKHEKDYCLDVVRSLGVDVDEDILPSLTTQLEADTWAHGWLIKQVLNNDKLVAIHPGASDPSKCWPVENFAALIQRIEKQGGRCVLVGGQEEKAIAQTIKDLLQQDVLDLTGSVSLSQLAALLKQCGAMVSNDSGPVHVGAAVGTPVISLFLRNQPGINPERWHALGEKSLTLANKPGEEILLGEAGQVKSGKFDSISVEEVFAAVQNILF